MAGPNTTACGGSGCGTVFKITPDGTLTTLYSFCSQGSYPNCADGNFAYALLIQAKDGSFYGTTYEGGITSADCGPSCGTVFKITPGGTLTTLYRFCSEANCADGTSPTFVTPLLQATDGNFYGTTASGGGANNGGTVFKMTPSGTLTTLYTFCSQTNCTDGIAPQGGLIQATDGNLYGTTYSGGQYNHGTVFKINVGN